MVDLTDFMKDETIKALFGGSFDNNNDTKKAAKQPAAKPAAKPVLTQADLDYINEVGNKFFGF